MTLPLPAVTPKTVAKLTQNSGKQKVLIDIFWFLTICSDFVWQVLCMEKNKKCVAFCYSK
jgi:hypothetical protein